MRHNIPRVLVFHDAYSYQVFEGPFQGCPAILDMQVVGEQVLVGGRQSLVSFPEKSQ